LRRGCKSSALATTASTVLFFGARLFSVVLLTIKPFVDLRHDASPLLKPRFALLVTACIGTFSAHVVRLVLRAAGQSEFYARLSEFLPIAPLQGEGTGSGGLLMLGTALGALLVTKLHFCCA